MEHLDVKNELDKVGCGFCLAKWTQVTMHLQTGRTHSCHHPVPHKVPLSELKTNPSALHNTNFKKEKRKEMLEGKRPDECQYCWNVEDTSTHFSDRSYKSSEDWSLPFMDEIKSLDWKQDFNPRYVEVSFSNACNFKCSYCGPPYSTQWMQESEKYGAYPTSTEFNGLESVAKEGAIPFKPTEYNPYAEAFWKWWPKLYRDLHTFRITGGEPLLSKDTWKVLDYIIEEKNPNTELSLAINSNLGVSDDLIDKLIDKVNQISDEKRTNEFVIYTSVDGWGEQAEYGRHGLVFNKFWDNLNKILTRCPTVSIGIMSTYNALSVTSYHKLIRGVYDLKREYSSSQRPWIKAINLDASYLRYPCHQTVQILPLPFAKLVKMHGEFVENNREIIYERNLNKNEVTYGFDLVEISKLKRIHDWMTSPQDPYVLKVNRKDFYQFVTEHDRRRGTDFVKTFPEFEKFYYQCKDIKLD
jgi:organic radical activating enzyme